MKNSNFKILLKQLWKNKLITFVSIFGIAFTVFFSSIMFIFVDSKFAPNKPATKKYRSIYGRPFLTIKDKKGKYVSSFMPSYHFWHKYVGTNKNIENYTLFSKEFVTDYSSAKLKTLSLMFCNHQFWQVYDFDFLEGRPFNEKEMNNGEQVVVINGKVRDELFPDHYPVLGQTINLDNKNYKIVGVVKDYYEFSSDYYLPVPLKDLHSTKLKYENKSCRMVATVKEKSRMQTVLQQVNNGIKADMENISGNAEYSIGPMVSNFKENSFMGNILIMFSIIFTLFLLLPILNLIYLNSYRLTSRLTEIGLRKSFGATKGNIRKQFIIEILIISFIGGIVGMLLAIVFKPLIIELLNAVFNVNYSKESLTFQWQYVFYLMILIIIIGLVSGIFPINQYAKSQIISSINNDKVWSTTSYNKRRKRGWGFLIVQFTLGFVLLFTATIFAFKFLNRLQNSIGSKSKDVVNIMAWSVYNDEDKEKVNANWPKVESYLKHNAKVLDFSEYHGFGLLLYSGEIGSVNYRETKAKASIMQVSPKFPEIMKLQLKEGDWFKEGEQYQKVPPVIINTVLSGQLFPNTYPLKKMITINDRQYYVSGICKQFYYHDNHNYMKDKGVVIIPTDKTAREIGIDMNYIVKLKGTMTNKDVAGIYSDIVEICGTSQFSNFRVASIPEMILNNWEEELLNIILITSITIFIILNLMLSLMSIIRLNVKSRNQEIGIRRAVGATRQRIYKLIISEMFIKALIACAIAFIIVFQSFIFNLFNVENWIYAISLFTSVVILFLLIGLFALWPANEATKVEPVKALHEN